ncbi:MAG: PorT family protein [Bacteroidales bacterium]|nr:PorT family protein [Bacteroidales bacterium]
MRYYLVIFIIGFLLPGVKAQSVFKRELNIGLSQGAIASRMVFDPHVSQDLFYGYTGGLMVRFISESQLGIQLEVNYMQRGWLEETKTSGTYKRSQEMLTIPLMTHIYFGRKTKMRFQVTLGPYVGYLLKDAEEIHVADPGEYRDYYGKETARRLEFGFTGGISAAIRTRIGIFELEPRYSHCLTNMFKPGNEEFIYLGSRPHAISLSLHYLVTM